MVINTKKMLGLLPELTRVTFIRDVTGRAFESEEKEGGKTGREVPIKAGETGTIVHSYSNQNNKPIGAYVVELSDPPRLSCDVSLATIKPVDYHGPWPIMEEGKNAAS